MKVSSFPPRITRNVTLLALTMAFETVCVSESVQAAESVSTGEAVSVFEQTCLAGLPNFSNFATLAGGVGLQKLRGSSVPDQVFQLPDQLIIASLVETPSGVVCAVTFESEDNAQQSGQAFLSAATRFTRSAIKKKYSSSFLEYAVQLSNDSLIAYELRVKNGAYRHTMIFSGPVSDQEIRTLIYN